MNDTFSIPPGGQVISHSPIGFGQIYGVWVNNFSGGWLGIEGQSLWVPPYTRGWKASIFPGISSISIRSYTAANGTLIAGATGQSAQVILWDTDQGDSEGAAFFDQQTIPLIAFANFSIPSGVQTLLAAPAVGRYRIYEIGMFYRGPSVIQPLTSAGVVGNIYSVTHPMLTSMEISPASPIDKQTIVAPGGDLSIGEAMLFQMFSVEDDLVDVQGNCTIYVRYAVI